MDAHAQGARFQVAAPEDEHRVDLHLFGVGDLGLDGVGRSVERRAVTLAELVPEVVAWARGPLAAIHGESLSDPRLTIFEGDVGDLIDGLHDKVLARTPAARSSLCTPRAYSTSGSSSPMGRTRTCSGESQSGKLPA